VFYDLRHEVCFEGALVAGSVNSVASTAMPLWLALTAEITPAFAIRQGTGTVESSGQKSGSSFERFGTEFPVTPKQIAAVAS